MFFIQIYILYNITNSRSARLFFYWGNDVGYPSRFILLSSWQFGDPWERLGKPFTLIQQQQQRGNTSATKRSGDCFYIRAEQAVWCLQFNSSAIEGNRKVLQNLETSQDVLVAELKQLREDNKLLHEKLEEIANEDHHDDEGRIPPEISVSINWKALLIKRPLYCFV